VRQENEYEELDTDATEKDIRKKARQRARFRNYFTVFYHKASEREQTLLQWVYTTKR